METFGYDDRRPARNSRDRYESRQNDRRRRSRSRSRSRSPIARRERSPYRPPPKKARGKNSKATQKQTKKVNQNKAITKPKVDPSIFPNHQQVKALFIERTQLKEIKNKIFLDVKRIDEEIKLEKEISKTKVKALEKFKETKIEECIEKFGPERQRRLNVEIPEELKELFKDREGMYAELEASGKLGGDA